MLLITFVENALKYGVSSSIDTLIDIALTVKDGVLTLTTSNPIRTKPTNDNHVGIGIENSRKRLDLIYGQDYTLDIDDKDGIFNLKLSITLNHNEP